MKVEYELDQWEWRGTVRSIEIDPEDYEGMTPDKIKEVVYKEIWDDAMQNLHFVYEETEVTQGILEALQSNDENDDE